MFATHTPMTIPMPFPRSIRSQLLALVLGVALPLAALIVVDHMARLASRVELAEDAARNRAGKVAATLTQLLESERAVLAALAARTAQRSERLAACDQLVSEALALSPYRANIAVVDTGGTPVCSAVALPSGVSRSAIGHDHVQRLLRTGEFSIGEPFEGRAVGRWVVPLVFPRRDVADRLIGWVDIPLDVERIAELLARGRSDRSDVITVISPLGRVISRSHDVLKWVGTDSRRQPSVPALLDGKLSAWRGAGLDGTARVWGAAEVPVAGWKVIVGLDEAKLFAPANAALVRNSLLIALVLLLVAGLAFGISRAITAPITALAQTLRRVAAGERALRAPQSGATGMAWIAVELNRMLDALDRVEAENASAAAALRESTEWLRLTIQASNVGLWDWDLRSHRVVFSREWKRQLGFGEDEIGDEFGEWESRVHPEDLASVLDRVRRNLAGSGTTHEAEFRMRHKDGSWRWIYARAEILRDAEARPVRMLGCHVDITQRKHADDALRESHDRLEALTRRLLEVQEAERRLIARELHDEVGAVLSAVKLSLQALHRAHTTTQRDAALDDSLTLVDGALQSVRSLSLDLRPAMLDDLGLIPTLKWYCARQAQRAGVAIDVALAAIDLRLAPQLESACFRIVQEAVTNALRHAGARRIQVTLCRDDGHFSIEIADDGSGFDATAARERGLAGESSGLLGMEERAKLLGGHWSVESAPGAGTRVCAEFVMPEAGFA